MSQTVDGDLHDRVSAAEMVYCLIRERLLEGEYAPGSALRELELASELNCSRTPVREALRRLASAGLVDLIPNKGARVARWMETDLQQIFVLRSNLEGYAARRAAGHISTRAIEELSGVCLEMEQVAETSCDARFDRLTELNNSFHGRILEIAGDRRLTELMVSVIQIGLVRHTFTKYSHDELARSLRHHRELLAAFEYHDPDWAEAVMRCHIFAARAAVANSIFTADRF